MSTHARPHTLQPVSSTEQNRNRSGAKQNRTEPGTHINFSHFHVPILIRHDGCHCEPQWVEREAPSHRIDRQPFTTGVALPTTPHAHPCARLYVVLSQRNGPEYSGHFWRIFGLCLHAMLARGDMKCTDHIGAHDIRWRLHTCALLECFYHP